MMVCYILTIFGTMEGKKDWLCLSTVMCVWLILITCVKGSNPTPCTDQTSNANVVHVKPMCTQGHAVYNPHVVIDTWDTGGSDVYSCTCTVILDQKTPPSTVTTVTAVEYPRMEPWSFCGSKLRITSTTSHGFTETGCTRIPATTATNFGTTDVMTLTLSRANNNTQWQSGHCILISSGSAAALDVSVNCLAPSTPIPQTPTTIVTSDPTTSSPSTIKSTEITTKSNDKSTTSQSQSTTIPAITNDVMTETSTNTISSLTTPEQETIKQQQCYTLSAVVAPLVVTLLLIIASVIGHIVIYKRRLVKQTEDTEGGTTPQSPTYDSLDLSRVEAPNVYADTSPGHMYINTAMKS